MSQLLSDSANWLLDHANREFPNCMIECRFEADRQEGFEGDVYLYYWVLTLADDFHNTALLESRLFELSHTLFLTHGIFITFRLRRIVHDPDLISDDES